MKVAFFTITLESGGAERHLLHLAHHWPLPRESLEIVLLENRGAWLSEVPEGVRLHALSDKAPRAGALKPLWALRQVPKVRRLMLERGYNVVMTFLWLPTVVAALAIDGLSPSHRPQLFWSVQSDLERDFRLHVDGWLRRRVVQDVLPPRVDRYIAVSRGIARRTVRLLGVPPERFTVIPNSVDIERSRRLAAEGPAIPPKQALLRVVSVGRLHPAKGFDLFLEAFALLHMERPDIPVEAWIVGEGPQRPNLEAQIRCLGLKNYVHLAGHSLNPYAWMATADVFVSPSRWETFGITVAEAMSLGCPVLATATDGVQDILHHGEDGWIVPVEDAQALAEGLQRLLTDVDLRRRLGNRARETAQQFDISVIVQRYATFLFQYEVKAHDLAK